MGSIGESTDIIRLICQSRYLKHEFKKNVDSVVDYVKQYLKHSFDGFITKALTFKTGTNFILGTSGLSYSPYKKVDLIGTTEMFTLWF